MGGIAVHQAVHHGTAGEGAGGRRFKRLTDDGVNAIEPRVRGGVRPHRQLGRCWRDDRGRVHRCLPLAEALARVPLLDRAPFAAHGVDSIAVRDHQVDAVGLGEDLPPCKFAGPGVERSHSVGVGGDHQVLARVCKHGGFGRAHILFPPTRGRDKQRACRVRLGFGREVAVAPPHSNPDRTGRGPRHCGHTGVAG